MQSAPQTPADPFLANDLRRYLAAHPTVTAAVYDRRTGKTWVARAGARDVTASIVKVDILSTLLADRQSAHSALTGAALDLATGMIENSNNTYAEDLWQDGGSATGVRDYNNRLNLRETVPDAAGEWGLTTTSAADQVMLLRQIAYGGGTLSTSSRQLALHLMHNVEDDQRWGVSAGVPKAATVAIKNGWLPHGSGWVVNSDGIVRGGGYDDVVSILSHGSSSEASGIAVIQHVARLLWPDLAHADMSG